MYRSRAPMGIVICFVSADSFYVVAVIQYLGNYQNKNSDAYQPPG